MPGQYSPSWPSSISASASPRENQGSSGSGTGNPNASIDREVVLRVEAAGSLDLGGADRALRDRRQDRRLEDRALRVAPLDRPLDHLVGDAERPQRLDDLALHRDYDRYSPSVLAMMFFWISEVPP